MKIRNVAEIEVPNHVGEALLAQQKRIDSDDYYESLAIRWSVELDENTTYRLNIPARWESVES